MPEVSKHDHFVLLGAGFSRAINARFPLLSDLSNTVTEKLDLRQEELEPFDRNIEQWLSYLAVDQPWLTDQENLRNHALFNDASRVIYEAVKSAELEVIMKPCPSWLRKLTEVWCDEEADLVSFNYDLLIERALMELGRIRTWSDIYTIPLEERMPAGSSGFLSADGPSGKVPRVYKLHGSINWAYGGLSAPVSDRIVLTSYRKFWRPDDEGKEANKPPRSKILYDDLTPLIVPPTLSKSSYYSGLMLRAQWRKAHEAIRSASRLTVIGYSFPPSDLTVRHFLASARSDAKLTVVDLGHASGDAVRNLLPGRSIEEFVGETAVEDFAAEVTAVRDS